SRHRLLDWIRERTLSGPLSPVMPMLPERGSLFPGGVFVEWRKACGVFLNIIKSRKPNQDAFI
ncbi:MAG: hypothetical protein ABF290_11540, partial [Thiogranum sp.]